MPNVNLDNSVRRLPKWDLTFTYGEKTYATRRPSAAQALRLAGAKGTDTTGLLSALQELFDEPAPDVGSWPLGTVLQFAEAYVDYFKADQQRGAKLSRAIAAGFGTAAHQRPN
jgi:hypothetical protein